MFVSPNNISALTESSNMGNDQVCLTAGQEGSSKFCHKLDKKAKYLKHATREQCQEQPQTSLLKNPCVC